MYSIGGKEAGRIEYVRLACALRAPWAVDVVLLVSTRFAFHG